MPATSNAAILERLKKTYGIQNPNVAERNPGPVQYRTFKIREADIDKEARTIDLSFSSDTPQKREDWMGQFDETLGHEPGEIDDSRMQSGAPLLVNHNTDDHVGTVVPGTFRVEGDGKAKKGRVKVRFGKSARAEEIFQDVIDGIRGQVSVGYNVNDWESKESQDNGLESVRVTNWTPCEVSLASIPLDQSVGVGRSAHQPTQPEKTPTMKRNLLLRDPAPPEGGGGGAPQVITVTPEKAVETERKRTSELLALADKFNCREEAAKWIRENTTIEAAKDWVLEHRMNAKPVTPAQKDTKIGMDQRDLKKYSLVRAMQCIGADRPLDGFELECSQEVAKKLGRSANGRGFFIPEDYQQYQPEPQNMRNMGVAGRFLTAMTRALGATFGPAGGFTVQTDVMGENMIELLRNRTYVMKLGARMLSGLVGDVAIPKQTGPGSAYWLAEGVQIPASQQVLGQMLLKPHQLGARTIYSKQLLAQSSIDVESFVREDLMTVSGLALDLAAINGAGGASPIGILNTTGVGVQNWGGAATWANVLQFENKIAQANADVENMNWMTTPGVRAKWKQIAKIGSTFPVFLWDDDNEVNGYGAYVTNQVPNNQVLFGNWADLFIATWAGMEVIVNPYTYASSGQVEVNVLQLADVGIRHPESFCVSTDSGAQ